MPLHRYMQVYPLLFNGLKANRSYIRQFSDISAGSIISASPSLVEMKMNGLFQSTSLLSAPVHWFETALAVTRDFTGLPWWASIIAWTVMIKAITLPFSIGQVKSSIRFQNIRHLVEPFQQAASQYQKQGNIPAARSQYLKARALMVENQCSPLRTLKFGFSSIPIFIAAFMSVKDVFDSKMISLQTGGALWFTDLTVPDPYYLLPLLSAIGLTFNVEAGRWMNPNMSPSIRSIIHVFSLLSIPITASLNSAVLLYFGTLNFSNAAINSLWRSSRIRSIVGIPDISQSLISTKQLNKKGIIESFKEAYRTRMDQYQRRVIEEERKKLYMSGPVEILNKK